MHTEHNTLKWCAVIIAMIIAIAAIAVTALQTAPVSAPATAGVAMTADNEEEIPVVKQMPEEMAQMSTLESLPEDMDGQQENQIAVENAETAKTTENTALTPVNVTIVVDGHEMNLMAAPATIRNVLDAYGIPVGENDKVKPALDQQLTADTTITIQRIVFEEVVESEVIKFKTKVEGTDELPAKTEKVVQKGQNGEDKVTYKVTYADGVEVARKEIARETVKKPVAKIIKRSTVGTINGVEYARKFTVKAYSYTGGGTTASGLPAAVGRIAVDPRVIPLGTRVYVEGYGFATAADTGGNIKGNTIDVYYNSESQCRQWGCRYITIYILK